jgi:hypothetical protein
MPYQKFIDLYLLDCAKKRKKLTILRHPAETHFEPQRFTIQAELMILSSEPFSRPELPL